MRTLCCLIALHTILPIALGAEKVDFNRDVRPILADTCFECHGPDEESRAADLRFDQFDEFTLSAIAPGRPQESELIARLTSDDHDVVMPPPESSRRPTATQMETLRSWVAQGANYEEHWSFVTPLRPDIPVVSDVDWPRNPIDSFVLSHLEQRGRHPQADADPRLLARRLSLVLTGFPVLPERADRFTAGFRDNPDAAVAAYVDELLAPPAYGEHFAWSWMDAARYADTNGYQADGERVMWPWRDWLIRSLNDNKPFDEMTRQMLAGDLLLSPDQRPWESADWIADDNANALLTATGFLRNHRYDTGSGTIPAESKFENAADRLETVGTVWMGLTLQCARCHTHKYDPVENREYYELLSFFDNVPEVGSALKGASHPYIHAPTNSQRSNLKRLKAEANKTRAAFERECRKLDDSQAAWESTLVASEDAPPRVIRDLRFRYAEDTIVFNGTRQIEKSNAPIKLCAGNKEWTISFWFRPDSHDDCAIFSSVEEPARHRPGIQVDWVDGKVRVRHVCRWVNSYIEFESHDELAVGKWHHVTFRCDGRLQGLAYQASLNGNDDAMLCTHPVSNDGAGNSGKAHLILGGSPLMPSFVGALRDLRFYDRFVEPDEVRSLADARPTWQIATRRDVKRSAVEQRTLRLAFLESDALPDDVRALYDESLAAVKALDEAIDNTPTVMVMQDAVAAPTRMREAGVYDSLGEVVETATPDFLPKLNSHDPDRLALANWLVDPQHPMTARVAVNRIWQALWGRGFVESPENFGTQCAKPVHAELLDWLATEYVHLGWDTKALIRLIVTSRTFRQRSDASLEAWHRDPANRHLGRGPRHRLPVSVVRDQALRLSGRLKPDIGGPPVVLDEVRGKDGKVQKLPYEVSNRRRTLYTFWKRNSPHPLLAVFDIADRNQCDVRIRRTNTPLQALVTLNETGMAKCAADIGQRASGSHEHFEDQLRWAWQACTGRIPDAEVLRTLKRAFATYRDLAEGDEVAAWTALGNVLLNLDATLTLE